MINVFMTYDALTQDLHHSLQEAGLDHPTVVLTYDGFLPEEVLAPQGFFMGEEEPGQRPLFFNELPVPDFWEISGNSQSAKVKHYHRDKARIFYAEPKEKRLINKVDWLDDQGRVRFVDCYNRYGRRYARISMDKASHLTVTTYFDVQGKEVLVYNHVTQDYILTYQGQTHFFQSEVDFFCFYLRESGLDTSNIIYNSLSTPFFVTLKLEEQGCDYLVWQEAIQDELPGNMKFILSAGAPRTQKIFIPDTKTYNRALEITSRDHHNMIQGLGYLYPYQADPRPGKELLILTNSDQIAHLDELTTALEDYTFSIAAITEMSDRLKRIGDKANVTLYPNASRKQMETLYQEASIYLDINYGNEILNSVRWAFDFQRPILAFEDTVHHRRFVGPQALLPSQAWQAMGDLIQTLGTQPEAYMEALAKQQAQADQTAVSVYQQAFQGGIHHAP